MRILSALFLLIFTALPYLEFQAQTVHCGVSPLGVVLHYDGPIRDVPVEVFKNGKPLGNLRLEKGRKSIESALKSWQAKLPGYPEANDTLRKYLFQSIDKATQTEAIYGKYYLTVKLAIGLAIVDESGKPDDQYTATLDGQNVPVSWERKSAAFDEPALAPGRYKSWYGDIESSWGINPKNELLFTRLFRKSHDSTDFKPVRNILYTMTQKGDSVMVIARDTLVPNLSYYQYSMVGFDFYGNASKPSPVMMADNLDNSTLPVTLHFSAKENEAKNQIHIRWKIKHAERVKSLVLQRSNFSDREFETISQLGPRDTLFVDDVTNPMEAVYYKLLIYDLKGLLDKTPMVPMVSHSKPDVMPPSWVDVQWQNGAPQLQWMISDRSARGFKVYRTETIGGELQDVSGFVDADTSIRYTWRDTSKYLVPGRSYHYTVIGQGKGYTESAAGPFVSIQIPDNTPAETPSGLVARFLSDNTVFLAWNTRGEMISRPQGFHVYRATQKNGPYTQLTKGPLPAQNAFTDTLNMEADTLYYAVSAMSKTGVEGAKSLPLALKRAPRKGIPFLLARATEAGTELSWAIMPGITDVEIEALSGDGQIRKLTTLKADSGKYLLSPRDLESTFSFRLISIFRDGTRSQPSNWVSLSE